MTELDIASRPDNLAAERVLKKHRVGSLADETASPPPASETGKGYHRGPSQNQCGGLR